MICVLQINTPRVKNTDVAENIEHGYLKLIRRSICYVPIKNFLILS